MALIIPKCVANGNTRRITATTIDFGTGRNIKYSSEGKQKPPQGSKIDLPESK